MPVDSGSPCSASALLILVLRASPEPSVSNQAVMPDSSILGADLRTMPLQVTRQPVGRKAGASRSPTAGAVCWNRQKISLDGDSAEGEALRGRWPRLLPATAA